MNKFQSIISKKFGKPDKQKLFGIVIVLILAVSGTRLLIATHAQSPYASSEAESGTLTGSATIQSDSNASGGKDVQFGSSTTSNSSFVYVCGTQLCLNGQPFIIHGGTAYGTYGDPSAEVALSQQAKVNTLEMVEFDTDYHQLSDTESSDTWDQADAFITAAHAAGLHVILNLSEYGQSLQAAGDNFTTTDWGPYLSFIANRVNTITGVQYKNDPTIAMVEIFGEAPSPDGDGGGCNCTTTQLTSFFENTMSEWHALAPNILVSSGGFSYLNDSGSGIDWKTIVSDPINTTCDMEINSSDDENITTPMFTSYCKSINKPWFLSAWSSCYQPDGQTYPFYTTTDAEMAAHAQDMYNIAAGGSPATYPAIGSDFWNLRNEGAPQGTCSISPSFPLTFAEVQNNAPN